MQQKTTATQYNLVALSTHSIHSLHGTIEVDAVWYAHMNIKWKGLANFFVGWSLPEWRNKT